MEINILIEQLETISLRYAREFDIERTPDWFLLKLTEELGELMQSYLKFVGQARTMEDGSELLKRDLEDELADVIGMALLIAKNQKIDIEEAIARKWLQYLPAESKEEIV